MVREGLDIVDLQRLGQLLNALARQAIDDARLPGSALYVLDDVAVHVLGLAAHLIEEVGAVEARLEDVGLDDTQVLLYVVLHLGGGGGRQRYHGAVAYTVDYGAQLAVLGTEVVPPLRDAVRLVDGVERNPRLAQESDVLLLVERLGGYI